MFKNVLQFLALGFALVLFLFGASLVLPKNNLTRGLISAWQSPPAIMRSIFSTASIYRNLSSLELENQSLRAEIFAMEKQSMYETVHNERYYVAKIYSTYPFNNRALVAIAAGKKQGIAEKMTVTVKGTILFGTVVSVFDDYSLVKTLYDPTWKSPVKIGKENVNALLLRGREPRLTLIVKNKMVSVDDLVYSAGLETPYGLTVGAVGKIAQSQVNAFDEAALNVPYDLTSLNEVYIRL